MKSPFDPDKNILMFIKNTNISDGSIYPSGVLERLQVIVPCLMYIIDNETEYQENCEYSWEKDVKNVNKIVFSFVVSNKKMDFDNVSHLLLSLFRLVYEKTIIDGEWNVDTEGLILKFMLSSSSDANENERLITHYWGFKLQQAYLSRKGHKLLKDINDQMESFGVKSQYIFKETQNIEDAINRSKITLDTHEKSVREISSEYNFVRLAGAFKKLIDKKSQDLDKSTKNLMRMGFTALAPLIFSLFLTIMLWIFSNDAPSALKDKIIYSLPVLVPIEIIIIYYFRIILKEHISLKAQILQLELRYSVCAFIEGYADFTKDIPREKLEKFEALIFSGITPDPSAIPGTFDGMDQLLNLARAAGGK